MSVGFLSDYNMILDKAKKVSVDEGIFKMACWLGAVGRFGCTKNALSGDRIQANSRTITYALELI
jgi:hypothetical protein